jgi:bifunctional aspartokinase / homoserine dehydrogenase 1
MFIHKFGGTSVGDAARLAGVADIILKQHNLVQSAGIVVVVSAMSGVTDQLIAGGWAAAEGRDRDFREIKANLLQRHLEAAEALLGSGPQRLEISGMIEDRLHDLERLYRSIAILGEFTPRGSDAVSSIGELLSANLLAAALRERGARAQAISAAELIVTDSNFGQARPQLDKTKERLVGRIPPLVERGIIPVITGYLGANEAGVTTTLGRGGSDYTAAILGAGLGAREVWIWSDVDGILTADPNLVAEAHTLSELSYTEAAELAYYGADVLHPKTIRPLIEGNIPLRILNSFNPEHPGTLIVESPHPGRVVKPAMISTTGLSLVAIGSRDDSWAPQHAAAALQVLGDSGVEVQLFSQSLADHSLSLVVRQQDQAHCLALLRKKFANGHEWSTPGGGMPDDTGDHPYTTNGTYYLGVKEKVVTVSVVGFPGADSDGQAVSRAFLALGKLGTRIIAVAQAGAGMGQGISFCIPQDQLAGAVRFLHRELGLEEQLN